jgi:hypothetical protein
MSCVSRRRRRKRNDHRRARPCRIGSLGREFLAERVRGREQQREKPSLTACDAVRRRKGMAVLEAENGAAQRDRDVAVPAAAHTWEQRQPRQGETDPQHARERRRRGNSRRLERRQEPRSQRGPCGCVPPILHLRQPQYLSPNIGARRPAGVPHARECDYAGPLRAGTTIRYREVRVGACEGVDLRSRIARRGW